MSIRLLHLVPSLGFTGPTTQMSLLARGLSKEQFEVRTYSLAGTGPRADELEDAGIESYPQPARSRWEGRRARVLRLLLREFQPHIVHLWITASRDWPLPILGALSGQRCVIVARRNLPDRSSAGLSWQDRLLHRLGRHFVFNSQESCESWSIRGTNPQRASIIPNGVQPLNGHPRLTRTEWLQSRGLPECSRVAIAVGPLEPSKRMKDVIWSMDLLRVLRDDIHLLVVGSGSHQWRLRRFRDQVHLVNHVHFPGPSAELPYWLSHADCLVACSATEAMPNSVLEAMAAGVPIVASDIAAHRAMLQSASGGGYLVPTGDRGAIARRLLAIMEDPAAARRLAAAGQRSVKEQYSAERMISRYTELYERLVA